MKLKKLATFIISSMICTSLLFGCSSSNQANKSGENSQKALNVGVAFFDVGLDPAIGWQGWDTVKMGVGETLVKVDKDLKTIPFLAEEFEQVDENTWEFKIRDNVKFHNGKTCDATAVMESIKRSVELNDRAKEALEGCTFEVRDNTVVLKTKEISPYIAQSLADPMFAIVDSEEGKNTEDFNLKPIATGPFKVESYTPEKEAVMTSFEDYYGNKAKLSTIKYIFIPDANTRMLALQSGEIDVTVGLGTQQLSVLEKEKDIEVERIPSMRLIYAMLNPKNEFLQDKKVRQALNYAIDKETLANVTLASSGLPAYMPYPESLGYNDNKTDVYKYDVKKAKSLLEESGLKDTNGDGILEKDGKDVKLRITYYISRPEMPIIAQYIQTEFKKVGIDAELISFDKQAVDNYNAGDFDIGFDSWTVATSANPFKLLNLGFKTGATNNFNGYFSDERIDEIAELLKSESNPEKQKSLATEANSIIVEEAKNIFFIYTQNSVSRKNNVKGFELSPIDYYQINSDVTIE